MTLLTDILRTTLLYALLLFTYGTTHLYFLYEKTYVYKTLPEVVLIIFNILSLLFLTKSVCHKGFINYNVETVSLLHHTPLKRFCRICNTFKPNRTHHCKKCMRCVKKMDHHCPWISGCVNHDNQASFVRFLLFTSLSNLTIAGFMCYLFYRIMFLPHVVADAVQCSLVITVCVVSLSVGVITGVFFSIQLRLILKNTTFIEELKYESYLSCGNECDEAPYDRGCYNNLKEVMGSPYLLFMCDPPGDGLHFEIDNTPEQWSIRETGIETFAHEVI